MRASLDSVLPIPYSANDKPSRELKYFWDGYCFLSYCLFVPAAAPQNPCTIMPADTATE